MQFLSIGIEDVLKPNLLSVNIEPQIAKNFSVEAIFSGCSPLDRIAVRG